jgi:hypothetical protein
MRFSVWHDLTMMPLLLVVQSAFGFCKGLSPSTYTHAGRTIKIFSRTGEYFSYKLASSEDQILTVIAIQTLASRFAAK